MYPSDSVDIQWIFSQCMYPLAGLSIEYYMDVSIGFGSDMPRMQQRSMKPEI